MWITFRKRKGLHEYQAMWFSGILEVKAQMPKVGNKLVQLVSHHAPESMVVDKQFRIQHKHFHKYGIIFTTNTSV